MYWDVDQARLLVRRRLETAESELQALREAHARLQHQHAQQVITIEQHQDVNRALRAERDALQAELVQMRREPTETNRLRDEVGTMSRYLSDAQADRDRLRDENARLKAQSPPLQLISHYQMTVCNVIGLHALEECPAFNASLRPASPPAEPPAKEPDPV